MVISKVLSGSTPVTVNFSNFTGTGTAQAWQLTSSNAITRLADISYSGSRNGRRSSTAAANAIVATV